MKNIVIIGAGFSGQGIVQKLYRDRRFRITLIDKNPYISYKPLYPDVASGRLSANVIEYPLEEYARRYSCDAIVGEAKHIDFEQKKVIVGTMNVPYDFLVIATGVEASFYGQNHFRENAYTIDSSEQCRAVQERLRYLMSIKKEPVSISIIGGGYTGIEFASHVRHYCENHKKQTNIRIIEQQKTILNGLPETITKRVTNYITSCGIQILTGTQVLDIKSGMAVLENKQLASDIIIWTAGMQGTNISGRFKQLAPNGRIKIDATARANGLDSVFIAGDASDKYRMSVPFAKQYAVYIAAAIKRLSYGKPIRPFCAKDYGYVVALAGGRGVGQLNGIAVDGLFGYLFHYFMCVLSLQGWRNKGKLIRFVLGWSPHDAGLPTEPCANNSDEMSIHK